MSQPRPRYEPPQPQRRTGFFTFNLKELLVVLGILGVLTAFLKPIFDQASSVSRRPGCLSNGKQLSLAVKMYSQDYDEHLPLAANWTEVLMPYQPPRRKPLYCEQLRNYVSGVSGYAMDTRLSGRPLDNIGAPHAERPLIFESPNLARNAHDPRVNFTGRHDGKRGWIGFVDGHVKMFTSEAHPSD